MDSSWINISYYGSGRGSDLDEVKLMSMSSPLSSVAPIVDATCGAHRSHASNGPMFQRVPWTKARPQRESFDIPRVIVPLKVFHTCFLKHILSNLLTSRFCLPLCKKELNRARRGQPIPRWEPVRMPRWEAGRAGGGLLQRHQLDKIPLEGLLKLMEVYRI